MNKKTGITVATLVIAMAIMSIVLGTAVISGSTSLRKSSLDKYQSQLLRIEEAASLYYEEKGEYPLYEYSGSLVEIQTESLEQSIKNEIVKKNDYQQTFYILDVAKLAITNMDIGKTVGASETILEKKDVFLINKSSGSIYYFAGLNINGNKVHSL